MDANGNATSNPNDGITNYTHDALNRPATIDHSDATPDVSFSYDANSNTTQMTDGAGAETYVYDALNRLTQVTRGSQSFAYQYDPASNLTKRTYPDSTVTDYTFDDDSRLATAASVGATTTYGYDAANNLLTTTLPVGNGHVQTSIFDRAGRMTEIKNQKGAAVLSKATYTLDDVGNPTKMVTTQSGTQSYKYDLLDRLTEVCFQATACTGTLDPFIRYAYDGVGNRTTETRPLLSGGQTTYSYNNADQLTQTSSTLATTAYSYDQNGNQTAQGAKTFAYDMADRLKSLTDGSTTTSYSYDGKGKRLQASKGSAAADKTNFAWDENSPLPELAVETDGAGASLRRYVHGQQSISKTEAGATSYYHHDALGSVTNVTDATGGEDWRYNYEPFGTTRTQTKLDLTAADNPMKFTGQYQDPTGLYHLRARQYDPTNGRFLTTDPLPPALTDPYVSAYVYANNRCTVMVDPSGLRGGCPEWLHEGAKMFGAGWAARALMHGNNNEWSQMWGEVLPGMVMGEMSGRMSRALKKAGKLLAMGGARAAGTGLALFGVAATGVDGYCVLLSRQTSMPSGHDPFIVPEAA